MKNKISLLIIVLFFFYSCQKKTTPESMQNEQTIKQESEKTEMKISSSSFKEGDWIPSKYSCDGDNSSPQLSWTGASEKTKSFAIISDDPDAPSGDWVHWVLFNIPFTESEVQDNIQRDRVFGNGMKQGINDFGKIGYYGPCPPGGTHRYFFKVYALDIIIDKDAEMSKKELLKAMEGHIVSEGQIMGKYKK